VLCKHEVTGSIPVSSTKARWFVVDPGPSSAVAGAGFRQRAQTPAKRRKADPGVRHQTSFAVSRSAPLASAEGRRSGSRLARASRFQPPQGGTLWRML
jgi:hypothetical protein